MELVRDARASVGAVTAVLMKIYKTPPRLANTGCIAVIDLRDGRVITGTIVQDARQVFTFHSRGATRVLRPLVNHLLFDGEGFICRAGGFWPVLWQISEMPASKKAQRGHIVPLRERDRIRMRV